MSSLFDVGKSALNSYRHSLAVTGQNIANINTEGYKRREAKLEEVTGSQGGITDLADQSSLGVRVTDIRRSFDQYLLNRARTATASFQKLHVYVDKSKQLEDMLLPENGDLGAQIASFFDSLREVAAMPAEIAARQVAIEQGKSMAFGFNHYALRLHEMQNNIRQEMTDEMNRVNLLAQQLADINSRILAAGQSGQSPNSIFDLRDQTISELAARIDLTVSYDRRGGATVKLGASGVGPILVQAATAKTIGFDETHNGLQPLIIAQGARRATNQIQAGSVAGLFDAYNIVSETLGDIDHLASMMGREMNRQHKQGFALDGSAGRDMFSSQGLVLEVGRANRSEVTGEIIITDPQKLPLTPLIATYSGLDDIWTVTSDPRAGDPRAGAPGAGAHFTDPMFDPLQGKAVIDGPGFRLQINGQPESGDRLLLNPFAGASHQFKFLLEKPQEIAASSGILISASVENDSDAGIIVTTKPPPPSSSPSSQISKSADLATLEDVFTDSASPMEATHFFKDGFVAKIPAGTNHVSLASLAQQATARFNISPLELSHLQSLDFGRIDAYSQGASDNGPFSFDINYHTAFPQADAQNRWQDAQTLADALNRGLLKTTTGRSLIDLGMFASGDKGVLTLVSASGEFDPNQHPRLSIGGGSITASLSPAMDASQIQLFTREGRHIAGSALSPTEIADILSAEHGFGPDAVYTATYLNQSEPAYRGMDIQTRRADGMHKLRMGSDGRGALAKGGAGGMPDVRREDSGGHFTMYDGGAGGGVDGARHAITLQGGASAAHIAQTINQTLKQTGIVAEAHLRVELFDFGSDGMVSFGLENQNLSPIQIDAYIQQDDLSNLATAINNQSGRTGVTATLSANKQRLVLVSAEGRDIFISDLVATAPQFTAHVVYEDGAHATAPLIMNSQTASRKIDHARFSGVLNITSAKPFSFEGEGAVRHSQADNLTGGFVSITSNPSADQKFVQFQINSEADANEASPDGLHAVAASARYEMDIPTSDPAIGFSASLTAAEISPAGSAHHALITALRAQAPLASMSGGVPAARPQSLSYQFIGPPAIDPTPITGDSFSITIDGTTLTVDMADGDGLGTSVTTTAQLVQAIARQINQSPLGVRASVHNPAPDDFRFTITAERGAENGAENFAVTATSFIDQSGGVTFQPTTALSAQSLPEEGEAVYIDFAGEQYKITYEGGELHVSGGEAEGRVMAYFDADNHLQIVAGGTLSGQQIKLSSDSQVAGNQAQAAKFGLDTRARRLTGTEITPDPAQTLHLNYDDTDIAIDLAADGTIVTMPAIVPTGLTIEFIPTTGGKGKLQITDRRAVSDLHFSHPQNAHGFKLADTTLKLTEEGISVASVSGSVQQVQARTKSLIQHQIDITDRVKEDILVFITGDGTGAGTDTGAKRVNSMYDIPPLTGGEQETFLLEDKGVMLQAMRADGTHIEVIDRTTGHSMATRILDAENRMQYGAYHVTMKGELTQGDSFFIEPSTGGEGDARNLDAMIGLHDQIGQDQIGHDQGGHDQIGHDQGGYDQGGFSDIFSTIIAGVGASVGASALALDGAEASMEAAVESEAEFSGVNLDNEATALIEFQQAYQASARILTTARELFQALIDVV